MGDVALGALALVLVAVLLPAERTHAARVPTKAPSPFPTHYQPPKSTCGPRVTYSCGTLAGIIVGCVVSGLCLMIIGCRQMRRGAAARQHNAVTTRRHDRSHDQNTTGTCSLSLALSAFICPPCPRYYKEPHMSFCVCRNRDTAANAQCASNVCAGNARPFEYCTSTTCCGPQDGHGGCGGGTPCPLSTLCPLSSVCAADGDGGCDGDGTVCPIGTGCAADGHTHRQRGWRRRRRSRRWRCCIGARAARSPAPGRRSLRGAVRGGEAARPGQGGVVCEPDLSRTRTSYPGTLTTMLLYCLLRDTGPTGGQGAALHTVRCTWTSTATRCSAPRRRHRHRI